MRARDLRRRSRAPAGLQAAESALDGPTSSPSDPQTWPTSRRKIIVDDVGYATGVYYDGMIAQAVNDVVKKTTA